LILALVGFVFLFLFRRRLRKKLAPSNEFVHPTEPLDTPFAPYTFEGSIGGGADHPAHRDPEMAETDETMERHPSILTPGSRRPTSTWINNDEPPPFTPGGYATLADRKLESAADGPLSREALERDHGYGGYGVGMGRQ